MKPPQLPDTSEFTIDPIHVPERRKNKWYALVSVTETGKRFFVTPFCGSPQSAAGKARAMIRTALAKHEAQLAEAGR